MLVRFSLAALSLLTAPVAAQTVLQPGSDALAEAPAETAEYTVRLIQIGIQGSRDIGSIAARETIEGDRLVTTSRLVIPMAMTDQTDSTVVAWPSLSPIYRFRSEPGESKELTFADGRAVGTDVEGDETREVDVAVTAADFGPGIARRVARSLPFEAGYVATFSQIKDDGDRTETTLEVVGSETLAHGGEDRDVWAVRVTEPGAPTFTYRVDAQTRDLLQIEFSPQPGISVQMTAD